MILVPGMEVGGCKITRELGRGGMGIVYLGVQVDLDRPVVIKVLSSEFKDDSPQMLRFRREARAIARLHHENVASVHHLGDYNNRPYLVMEYIEGESAYEYLRRAGRVPVGEALKIARDVARGLQAAHAARIIHRDVKPGNVLLGKDGTVKLVDFGLAKETEEDPSGPKLSRSGYIIGTPWYLAPEQVEGDELTGAADVYALGISMYHMMVGELPFQGPMVQVVMHQLNTPLPDIQAKVPECPQRVQDFIERMCAKDVKARPSVRATIEGLTALEAGRPLPAARPRRGPSGDRPPPGQRPTRRPAGARPGREPGGRPEQRAPRRDRAGAQPPIGNRGRVAAIVAVVVIVLCVIVVVAIIISSGGRGSPGTSDTPGNTDSRLHTSAPPMVLAGGTSVLGAPGAARRQAT